MSLFDGISCGRVALERVGFDVESYFAYEIEKNAIEVSKHNYPDIIQCGDVFAADFTKYEGIDLLIGGSPCTYWSIAKAGNNNTRETTNSGIGWDLFSQYVRALKEAKPKYFLYENNNSMSKQIKDCITKELGVEPILIDSADFSAQRRKRLYWTNIPFNKEWDKSNKVFKDIYYDAEHKFRDFSKYKDTVRWNKNHTTLAYDASGKGYYSQGTRGRTDNIKMCTVCGNPSGDKNNIYIKDYMLRLIHPVEAERLQTLPDNYTDCINGWGRRIALVGNGWTVDVIAHILEGIK